MFYILLITVILNGHPDTQAAGVYIDKSSCIKAMALYKVDAKARKVKVIDAKCDGGVM